jgi:hypothetical protein
VAYSGSNHKGGPPRGNQNAKGNRGGPGTKTKYKPEFASEQTTRMCMLGCTDAQLAAHFGCDESQIAQWARKHVDFARVLNAGRNAADVQVVRSLFQRAVGYSYTRSRGFRTVQVQNERGEWVSEEREILETIHVPGDVTAQIYWLCNRRRDFWKRGDSGHEREDQRENRNKLRELWSALAPPGAVPPPS